MPLASLVSPTSLFGGNVTSFEILKRLGGNERGIRCPLLELGPDRSMKTHSYIRLFALLKLGNALQSEAIGQAFA
jgi:hypothetical protein